jgi:hypothetical protein
MPQHRRQGRFTCNAGNDIYTKLLLHGDGADGSTVFTDSTYISPKTGITRGGTAQIDTAQSVSLYPDVYSSSILIPNFNSYILVPHSDDFSGQTHTIDFRIRFASLDASGSFNGIFGGQTSGGSSEFFYGVYLDGATWVAYLWNVDPSSSAVCGWICNPALVADTWYHFSLTVYTGNDFRLWQNGTELNSYFVPIIGGTVGIPHVDSGLYIGTAPFTLMGATVWWSMNGWIDEFRWSKDIRRQTANFTVPTLKYL